MPAPGLQDAPRTDLAGYGDADAAVAGPQARAAAGVTGAGVKIGILSDSFNLLGGEASDIAQGLLPAGGATILEEGPAGSTDEGRALAQLIHATAPGAQLYFYSAAYSPQDYANGIAALAAVGCQVIVDDIVYPDEPFFQVAGPIDDATAQVVAQGVNYFAAAGNEGTNFFQGAWTGADVVQTVTIPAGLSSTLSLQWDAPYAAANPPTLTALAAGGAGGTLASYQVGSEPVALIDFPVSAATQTYRVAIAQTPGTPTPSLFKDILEGGGSFASAGAGVGSGSIIGQGLVPGVNAVGAVDVAQAATPTPEPYSSTGPGELLFAPDGTRFAAPETGDAPGFLAPDGTATSLFDPFFGTSAAAPVAAATAALLLQARPALANTDITALLDDSAAPAGAASLAGAGLIDAALAVNYAQTGVIFGSRQATVRGLSLPCTLAGGAGSHMLVAGSGPALLGSEGTDTVVAGAGADTVDLAGPAAVLFGAGGPLWVRDFGGADTVVAGSGSMTVSGGAGGGAEWGSAAGRNLLVGGAAPTELVAGGAADTLVAGGAGNDSLFAPDAGAVTMFGNLAGNGDVYVASGAGNDLISAGAGASQVFLGGGADTVFGGSGQMLLGGGAGTALAFGGAAGGNLMFAGSGAATLVGGGTGDILVGNGGGDLLVAAPGGGDSLFGGSGVELLVGGAAGTDIFALGAADALVAPEAATSVVTFGSGQSTVQAGSAAELFNFVAGAGGGTDIIEGFDPSRDMLRLAGFGAAGPAAVAAQAAAGGSTYLSLSDGTTVAFAGLAHLNAANVVFA